MRVYLAGPINGCGDDEANNWRSTVKGIFARRHVDWLDPMDRDERGKEANAYAEIVEGDKADIDECDAVFAFCWQPSVGTSMEILYAHSKGKPVMAVIPRGKPVSPWIRYHAKVEHNLRAAAINLCAISQA
jgi:nucleoside 2-deoxyribosyltransferase